MEKKLILAWIICVFYLFAMVSLPQNLINLLPFLRDLIFIIWLIIFAVLVTKLTDD